MNTAAGMLQYQTQYAAILQQYSLSPQVLQERWEREKLLKYGCLNRFHRDLQRDPTRFTRFNNWPQAPKRIPVDHHSNIPWSEISIAIVGSLAFAAVFGFAGWVLSTGNAPNHHVLDHLKPTLSQQFRFQGRVLKDKVKNGKLWAQIGILFAVADWWFLSYYDPEHIHNQAIISSFIAGGAMAIRRGVKPALFSGLGFVAFTGLIGLFTSYGPEMDFFGDQYANIDPRRPPGAPPDWKPFYETIPLMPRDQRVVFRDDMRAEQQRQLMEQQQMQMQMQMQGQGGGGPMGPGGPGGPGGPAGMV